MNIKRVVSILISSFLVVLMASLLAFADGSINQTIQSGISPAVAPSNMSATIYVAKTIITMERSNPRAEAVAVAGGKIVAVGKLSQVKKALGTMKYNIDRTLESKIIMPGLIDQHLHPVLGSLTLAVEVIAPEDWVLPGRTYKAAGTPEEYISRLKNAVANDKNKIFFTWGYHKLWHGKIDRRTLDRISATKPIVIWQRSCHEFYLNSAAIRVLDLTEDAMKNKGDASKMYDWDEGHWWETGLNLIINQVMAEYATPQRMTFGLTQMVEYLHQKGVTAYCEPGALYTPDMWKLYEKILGADSTPFYSYFIVDGRGFVDQGIGPAESLSEGEKIMNAHPVGKVSFFPKQIKLFVDGAIISQLMQMKDGYTDGHQGVWMMTPEHLEERTKLYWDAGYQIHTHVNGDLGLEVLLCALERRMKENPRVDHRSVIVHFANSTVDQVDRIAKIGAIVSANPYYTVGFADMYSKVGLGPERANAMVRSGSVLKRHISLSFHSDLPMGPSEPLFFVWCAVNRVTPSGRVACPQERIGIDDALRAITIDAAYSWRKEADLGSITNGKTANLTVLEQDPYKVEPMKIKDIAIWGTMFEGRLFPVTKISAHRRIGPGMPRNPSYSREEKNYCSGHEKHNGACCACTMSHMLESALKMRENSQIHKNVTF